MNDINDNNMNKTIDNTPNDSVSQKAQSVQDTSKGNATNDGKQTSSDTGKNHIAKAWYWMAAALLVIVLLIVALAVQNSNNKKAARKTLAGAVASVNSRTPSVGVSMVLDSVTYDAKANLVTYYYAILKLSEANQQLLRNYYCQISDKDFKILQKLDFEHDYLSDLIKDNKSSLRYVYSDVDGKVLKDVTLSHKELLSSPAEKEIKHASLVMIAQEAKTTQANCPQQIDEATSITNCVYDSAAANLTFSLALNRPSAEIDMADFQSRVASQKEAIVHALAHDTKYASSGVTVVYKYYDKNGAELNTVTITPKEYLEHKHEHEHEHDHEE